MPSPSTNHPTCQVIPGKNESPCIRIATNSFKKGSGTPPLCWSHRQEYFQQYKAYKGSSRVSEALSEKVWKLLQTIDWTCPTPVAMERAENALAATRRCIVALDKEICERESHHKRFFTQVHLGHENWIYVLRKRRERVEDSAEKLRLQTMIATEAEAARLKALGGARNPFLYTHSLRVWTIPMMSMTPSIGAYNACDRRDNEHDKNRRMAVQTVTALYVIPHVGNHELMLAVRVVRSVVVLAD